MKVYRDLVVSGPPGQLHQLRDRLSRAKSDHWRRVADLEQKLVAEIGGEVAPFAFQYTGGDWPKGNLWLFWRHDYAEVTNIVPVETSEITHDDYNALVEDFGVHVLDPLVSDQLEVRLGPVTKSFDDVATRRALQALRTFSTMANKSSRANYPTDAERWRMFLILTHADAVPADSVLLADWLVEVGNWPEDAASELSLEYVAGRELLSAYDAFVGRSDK